MQTFFSRLCTCNSDLKLRISCLLIMAISTRPMDTPLSSQTFPSSKVNITGEMRSRMNRNKALAIRLRKASAKKKCDFSPINRLTVTRAASNGIQTFTPDCSAQPLLPCPCLCHAEPRGGQQLNQVHQFLESEAPWRDLGYFLRQDLTKYEPEEKDYIEFIAFYLDSPEGKKSGKRIWLTYIHLNKCHQVMDTCFYYVFKYIFKVVAITMCTYVSEILRDRSEQVAEDCKHDQILPE